SGPVRMRAVMLGGNRIRLDAVDDTGVPVLSAGSLEVHPVERRTVERVRANAALVPVHGVEWLSLPPATAVSTASMALLGAGVVPGIETRFDALETLAAAESIPHTVVWAVDNAEPGSAEVPAAAHRSVEGALVLVRAWLAEPALTDSRLIVLTRSAL